MVVCTCTLYVAESNGAGVEGRCDNPETVSEMFNSCSRYLSEPSTIHSPVNVGLNVFFLIQDNEQAFSLCVVLQTIYKKNKHEILQNIRINTVNINIYSQHKEIICIKLKEKTFIIIV